MKDNSERLNKKQKFYLKSAVSIFLCVALVVLCNIDAGFVTTVLIIAITMLLIYMVLN
ncbi:MAG: hypothetical protein V8T45_02975 [Oscillospiraceae bacterium]